MRPIDADYLESKVHRVGNESGRVYWFDVEDAPTLDVKPIVPAQWISCENETGEGSNTYKCSSCGEIQMLIDGTPKQNGWKYCPHCAAKMDEDNENG